MTEKLFHMDLSESPLWKKFLIRFLQFVIQLFEQFSKDQCATRASGLAYASLLAFVPLVAVTFSLFTSFSAFSEMKEGIQSQLFNFFIPAKGGEILNYINQFAANTKTLGVVGTVFLMITAIMLFQNIEKSINGVWRIEKQRKFITKFVIFTSVLIWGTVFIGASFYITGKVKSLMAVEHLLEIGIVSRIFFWLFPMALSVLAFILVMLLVPNTKVRWQSAAVGGATGGILWEMAKGAFAHYAAKSVNYSVIYGSLALVPIFLVWLYLTWIIVMLATEATYVYQHFESLNRMKTHGIMRGRQRLLMSLQIYLLIAARFFKGEKPVDTEEIIRRFALATHQAKELLDDFMAKGLISLVDEPKSGFMPSQTLDEMPATHLVTRIFNSAGGDANDAFETDTDELAEKLLGRMEQKGRDGFHGSVADLLRSMNA